MTIRIELYDPDNATHFREIHNLFDLQSQEAMRRLDEEFPRKPGQKARIMQGPVTEQVRLERVAAEKITDRAIRSKQTREAFAHVAIRVEDRKEEDDERKEGTIIGYIISHQKLEEPLRRHAKALKSRFPQLKNLADRQFEQAVLSGEHSYVRPDFRDERIGSRLFDAHEAEATQRGYHVRASYAPSNNKRIYDFLRHRGYRMVAKRRDGVRIMAKKLGSA